MDVREAIARRRSVRAYTQVPVDDETIRALLRAAVDAPSAMNAQPWVFAVVQRDAMLERISETAKRLLVAADHAKARKYRALLSSEAFDIFYGAGTVIVIGADAVGPYTDADCWLAAENLMLAACALGLGTCCVGFALPALHEPELKAELGIPEAGAAVAAIAVGWPAGETAPVPRRAPRVVSWLR